METNNQVTLVPGSVLSVWLPRYGVWHKGVLDWPDYSGVAQVMHNSKSHGGTVSTSLPEFAEGQPYRVIWVPTTREEQDSMIARARQGVGQIRFDLLESNCEDFVNWVKTGKPYSETRDLVFVGLLALAGAGLVVGMARSRG